MKAGCPPWFARTTGFVASLCASLQEGGQDCITGTKKRSSVCSQRFSKMGLLMGFKLRLARLTNYLRSREGPAPLRLPPTGTGYKPTRKQHPMQRGRKQPACAETHVASLKAVARPLEIPRPQTRQEGVQGAPRAAHPQPGDHAHRVLHLQTYSSC